ncbi:autotransporter assembly complex protein TamA [Altererythrobacter fulvus]|uniref:autotransporter assembly complex protein TamA n=1 Tax=Caenibius fulvus TaxID=2126012 RepID=UPI00301908E0
MPIRGRNLPGLTFSEQAARGLRAAVWLVLAAGLCPPAHAQDDASAPKPIVSDEEFEKALPPLDGDLESIEEWEAEQRRLEEQAVLKAGAMPMRVREDAEKAAADEAAAISRMPMIDDMGEPVPLDSGLDEPLPPLSEFDLEPVDAKALGEDTDLDRQLRYDWRIDGLEGLQGTVSESDIRSRFRSISALDDGDGDTASGTQLSSRLTADRQLLADILSAAGHFDAVVAPAIELPPPDGDGRAAAILEVQPGPQYVFGKIAFDAPPVEPDDLIRRYFPLKSGDPILAEDVLAAEAGMAVGLPRNGYPFAQLGQRDILLDDETRTGDYTLPVTPGPRSRFGDVIVEGEEVFDPEHIYVLARFKRGDLYDSDKLDDLRDALVATGLFAVVAVEPRETGRDAGEGTQFADLAVRQTRGPQRSISLSAGYSTGQGLRAEGSWTHRNLFPPEGALILSGLAGTQEQGLSATFRRSNAGRRDRTVELALSALHSNYDAYNAYTGRLAGRISYDSTPIWQKKLTYSYGFELLASSEKSYVFVRQDRERRTYYIAALPGQLGFDTTNDLLDPVRGFRLNLKLSPEYSGGDQNQFYARGMVEGSAYRSFGDFVLAGRVRVGSIVGTGREDLAPSRRYYAGGGGSVRGFGYQELGPKDPDANPVGGRSLVEGAIEARYRFGDYGVVAFVDAGQVYESSMPGFNDIRFGAGIGGRFYTNFGPVRLDVATPLGRKEGESRIAVYVSIGQAF